MGTKGKVLMAAAIAYPLALHGAVATGHPRIALGLLLGVCALGAFLARPVVHASPRSRLLWLAVIIFSAVALFMLLENTGLALLYIPPILINGAMVALFLGSLGAGRDPVISRFARIERGGGELPPDIEIYARRLTGIWGGLFAAMAIESALLAAFAPLELWSLFTNILNYVFVTLLFAGEYLYRRLRFRHHSHPSPWAFFAMVWRNRRQIRGGLGSPGQGS